MNRSHFQFTVSLILLCFVGGLLAACTQPPMPTVSPLPTTSPSPTTSPLPLPKTATPAMSPIVTPVHEQPPTPEAAGNYTFLPRVAGGGTPTYTLQAANIPTTTIPINLGGLHVEATGDHTGYEEFLRACAAADRPVALIKVFGDGYSAKMAKEIDPRTVTIWRKPVKLGGGDADRMDNPPGDWNWPESATADMARRWMQAMYPEWETQREYIDYFEIMNEPNPATITQTQRAADFVMEAMKDAERQDPPYKLAIWSFSSGTPEPWQAEIMIPTLRYAAQHGHILSVHDGSVDDERRLFRQAFKDGTAFRYRMFQPLLGPDMPRVAVTEAYQPGGYANPDWYDWQWYLTEMANDDAIGAAWFTLGPYSFGGDQTVNVVKQLPAFALVLGCR